MVKLCVGPVQVSPPFEKVGVTVMVATSGAVPVFIAVKELILPLPFAPRPIEVLVFVQV